MNEHLEPHTDFTDDTDITRPNPQLQAQLAEMLRADAAQEQSGEAKPTDGMAEREAYRQALERDNATEDERRKLSGELEPLERATALLNSTMYSGELESIQRFMRGDYSREEVAFKQNLEELSEGLQRCMQVLHQVEGVHDLDSMQRARDEVIKARARLAEQAEAMYRLLGIISQDTSKPQLAQATEPAMQVFARIARTAQA